MAWPIKGILEGIMGGSIPSGFLVNRNLANVYIMPAKIVKISKLETFSCLSILGEQSIQSVRRRLILLQYICLNLQASVRKVHGIAIKTRGLPSPLYRCED